MADLYDDLGVPRDADADEIRKAHRKRVRHSHPDHGGDREEFEKVQHAYLILRDPKTRDRYDRTGDHEVQPDNDAAELASMLVGAFDQATSQCQQRWTTSNLKKAMLTALAQRKQNAKSGLTALAEGKKALETLMKRLHFKGAGTDYIGSALSSRLRENEQSEASCKAELAMIERAEAYAADYDYEFDPAPPPSASPYRTMEEEMLRKFLYR